jgi:hypothetical protein
MSSLVVTPFSFPLWSSLPSSSFNAFRTVSDADLLDAPAVRLGRFFGLGLIDVTSCVLVSARRREMARSLRIE